MRRKSEKARSLRIVDSVRDQIASKCDEAGIEDVSVAHKHLVVLLNPLDFKYMMNVVYAVGARHKKGSQKELKFYGFEVWQTPTVPFGSPKLHTREDAVGLVGEFAEKLHGVT